MLFNPATRFKLILSLLLIYWLAMFVGTHIPLEGAPGIGHGDKVIHFCGYGGLGFLAALALSQWRPLRLVGYLSILAGVMVYGVFDEVTQSAVRTRSPEFADWVADCCGLVAGLVTHFAWSCWRVRLTASRRRRRARN